MAAWSMRCLGQQTGSAGKRPVGGVRQGRHQGGDAGFRYALVLEKTRAANVTNGNGDKMHVAFIPASLGDGIPPTDLTAGVAEKSMLIVAK